VHSPLFIPKVFTDEYYSILRNRLEPLAKTFPYNPLLGRYLTSGGPNDIIDNFARLYLTDAMRIFGSKTLRPTYTSFVHYEAKGFYKPALPLHVDDNACTYTIDMCLYQTEPWGLVVEGQEFTLLENQGLAFQSCDLRHWRPQFPNPDTQHVAMVFFHYAEPDHWFFTKGRDYYEVVHGRKSEEEWMESRRQN
jgi:hypothetical protein